MPVSTPAHAQECYTRAAFNADVLNLNPQVRVLFEITGDAAMEAALIFSAIPPLSFTISDLSVVYGADNLITDLWTLWLTDCMVGSISVTREQRRNFLGVSL